MWWNKKRPEEITFHPKLNIPIKFAFECDGDNYYSCVNDYEMPKKRFKWAMTFYSEMQNKITSKELGEFCDAMKVQIDEGKLGQAYKLVDELSYRNTWIFDPDSLIRFASVIYFTLKENLADYDNHFNDLKIDSFKKKGMLIYFLKMLTSGQKLLSELSTDDLTKYLSELTERKESQQKLISELKVREAKTQTTI